MSFQRMRVIELDENLVNVSGTRPASASLYDNILLNKIDFSNFDLMIDFLKLKNNWVIGTGIGLYNGGRTFLKSESIENSNSQPDIFLDAIYLGNYGYSKKWVQGPTDFMFYGMASKQVPITVNNQRQISQYFGFGLGFTKNKKSSDMAIDEYGTISYEPYLRYSLFPFIMLNYEFEVVSKRGGNLFNLNIFYNQGILKVGKLIWIDTFQSGIFSKQESITRGSSLGLSISKSITLKLKTK